MPSISSGCRSEKVMRQWNLRIILGTCFEMANPTRRGWSKTSTEKENAWLFPKSNQPTGYVSLPWHTERPIPSNLFWSFRSLYQLYRAKVWPTWLQNLRRSPGSSSSINQRKTMRRSPQISLSLLRWRYRSIFGTNTDRTPSFNRNIPWLRYSKVHYSRPHLFFKALG